MIDHSNKPVLLILGAGVVSAQVLDILVRTEAYSKIVIASRSLHTLVPRVNLARLTAANLGYFPKIVAEQVDLRNIDQTAALIASTSPAVIFQGASLWTWWRIRELPARQFAVLDSAGVGPWLPLYLALTFCLMRSLQASGLRAHVVNACFPDATNACLNSIRLAPTIGIGNIANSVPLLRIAIADSLGVPPDEVTISLYGHHWAGFRIPSAENPLDLPILVEARTNSGLLLRGEQLRHHLDRLGSRYPRVRGLAGQGVTVTSAVSVLRALAGEAQVGVHAPGPLGLEGGFPCLISSAGVSLAATSFSLEEAQAVNRAGQRLDGISAIESDVVHFTPENVAVLRRELGYEVEQLRISDCLAFARDLLDRYEAYSKPFDKRVVQ